MNTPTIAKKKKRDPVVHIRISKALLNKIDELAVADRRDRTSMVEIILDRALRDGVKTAAEN